jgi:hypothetical protein
MFDGHVSAGAGLEAVVSAVDELLLESGSAVSEPIVAVLLITEPSETLQLTVA